MPTRPCYRLHRKTWLALAAALVLLSPLLGGIAAALLRARAGPGDGTWTGPLEFMALGLLVFCVAVLGVVAAVSERWQRLREGTKEEGRSAKDEGRSTKEGDKD